jgi:cobalt-zinc-cadmium efflux system outer membrane protein
MQPIIGAVCVAAVLVAAHTAVAEEPHTAHSHAEASSVYRGGDTLTLHAAISRALDHSPRLRSATAVRDAAEGEVVQSNYWSNPQLTFEAENIAGTGQYSGLGSGEYTYGLIQQIPMGGKRATAQTAAQAGSDAAALAIEAERLILARDVHIAYEQVLTEAEAVQLAIEQEQLANDVLQSVKKRVNAAAEPDIQLSKAQVAVDTAAIALQQEKQQLALAKLQLAQLWGATELDVSLDHAHFFALEAPQPLEYYRNNLEQLPDIRRLVHLQAQKQALMQWEQAQNTPDPSISLGVRDLRGSNDQAFVLGVSLPIPVLNRNQGNITRARAQLMQAESDAEQTTLLLQQELAGAWHNWQTAFVEAERLRGRLIPTAEKAFRQAREGYDAGRFSYLEVLDAQRTLFDARKQYHLALQRYHTSRAQLERLTSSEGENS